MTGCDYEAHLEHIRSIYRKKSALTDKLLDDNLGGLATYHPVQGGLFYWLTLPEGKDMQAFCTKAAENKVAVVPGTAFVIGDEKCNSFRINYSAPTDEKLTEAVQILGRVAKEF